MLTPKSFDGFVSDDFDAFLEHKWSSNRFNLERMKVLGKLGALGKVLAQRLADQGLALECEPSQSNPTIFNNKCVDSGWCYFYRPAAERKALASIIDKQKSMANNIADPNPHHQHIILAIRIDQSGVEAGLRIHHFAWLDGQNLFQKIKDSWERSKFVNLLGAVPGDVAIRLDDQPLPRDVVPDDARLDAAARAFGESTDWIHFVKRIGKDDPRVAGPELLDALWESLKSLTPLYEFIAWSKSNDHVAIKGQLRDDSSEKRVSVASVLKDKVEKKRAGITDLALAPKRKVTILNGLFQNKSGIVESIDKKGNARVIIGNLTVNLPAKDLRVIS